MPVTIGGSGPITGVTSINTTVTDTELGYLDGVSSALQTQLAGKADISTNGAWTAFTPTWVNLTVGNGTNTGVYVQIGKLVHARYRLSFGSTTSVAGIFYPNPPITADGGAQGVGWAFDNSATKWNNLVFALNAYLISDGGDRYNATTPWTWAVSDILEFSITYQAG